MNYKYSKRDIKNLILSEGKEFVAFKKSDLRLNEAEEDVAQASSIDDIDNAVSDSKTKDVSISGSKLDGNASTDRVTVNLTAKNAGELKNKLRQQQNNPQIKKLGQGNVDFQAHIGESVMLTKKELNEMLNN